MISSESLLFASLRIGLWDSYLRVIYLKKFASCFYYMKYTVVYILCVDGEVREFILATGHKPAVMYKEISCNCLTKLCGEEILIRFWDFDFELLYP